MGEVGILIVRHRGDPGKVHRGRWVGSSRGVDAFLPVDAGCRTDRAFGKSRTVIRDLAGFLSIVPRALAHQRLCGRCFRSEIRGMATW